MYVKQQTVIPAEVKIKRLPPSTRKVPSLFVLERRHERQLENKVIEGIQQKRFAKALAEGMSVDAALRFAMEVK